MHGSRSEVIHRDAAGGGLVYKTKQDARVQERAPAVLPPKTAPNEPIAWWEWTQQFVKAELNFAQEALIEAAGQAMGIRMRELRTELTREIDFLKRELLVLRQEVGVERKLKELTAAIPVVPDIEARLTAKQAEMRREIASLKRGQERITERVTEVHGELSAVRYQFEKKSPKPPAVTVTLNTPESSFVVRDDDPAASEAWQRFMQNVVESNPAAKFEGHVDGKA